MNPLDKAFIKAYRQQGVCAGKMMPLSDALELSRRDTEETPETTQDEAIEDVAASEPSGPSGPSELQALLQVDDFAWPRVCTKLDTAAGEQIEAVSDRVTAQADGGRKVIGFTSDCAGSGCTTLLLCVAKRLANDLRVVVVDTNGDNPSVARGLGLLPDVGWKDVAADRLPLGDALIDSVNDDLTVLPYSGHQDIEYGDGSYRAGSDGSGENLRRLAVHYDLVLIDLGTLPTAWGDHSVLKYVDAAVIVRSACVAAADASRRVGQILQASGVEIVGAVENRHIDPDSVYEAA